MPKKKRQKPSIGSDPFSGHEEIMQSFFSPGPEPEIESIDNRQFSIDNDMFPAFQSELEEGLERLDPLLVDLEKKPDDADLVNEAFRIVHTIKGSSGFMQFNKLKHLCHATEGLLSQVRSKKLQLSVALMDIILQAVDKMKEAGLKIKENRNEEEFDAGSIVFLLESLSGTPETRDQEPGTRGQTPGASSQSPIDNRQSTIEKDAPAPCPLPPPPPATGNWQPVTDSGIDKSIIDDFIIEAQEGLDQLDADLIALEENPEDKELLNKVFRIMHTLKGAAGFIGLTGIQATAHKSEDVLNKIRFGELKSSPIVVDVLLEALDVVKNLIKDLAGSGVENTDNSHVVKRLQMVLDDPSQLTIDNQKSSIVNRQVKRELLPPAPQSSIDNRQLTIGSKQTASAIRVDVDKLDNLMNLAGELVLARNRQIQLNRDIAPELSGKEKLMEEAGAAANQLDFLATELQFAV
ncbi:MAG: Hpt domain-containing protein, partial [Nitrospinae bacterium]|nr:Hpt domain-containing protein [Nitrospinota bacterium]